MSGQRSAPIGEAGTMVKAVWNGAVIAESDATVKVEGNHYFPASSVRVEYLEDSLHRTVCAWKGEASYYSVVVDGRRNPDAAWYYAEPKALAAHIKDHVAFWHGVRIVG
ncbi:DUF427 domain-containing protein [Arthrobacter sp. ISL-28]|uniref:DUF427 domain-containing protein n=1 Tax=Arthrobacter sp. ISL-28 TaxID=2819108 RepID=UPI002034BE8F|nr:DUF427 domain-containing protein [Arthrobacter sp. ISL-28]